MKVVPSKTKGRGSPQNPLSYRTESRYGWYKAAC